MIKIEYENIPDDWMKRVFDGAALFFAKELGIEYDNIRIKTKSEETYVRDIPDGKRSLGVTSSFLIDGWVDITIRERAPFSTLSVLAHEMVHGKQIIKNELIADVRANAITWKGELLKAGSISLLEAFGGPMATPWENEAHKLGPRIMLKYLETIDDDRVARLFLGF